MTPEQRELLEAAKALPINPTRIDVRILKIGLTGEFVLVYPDIYKRIVRAAISVAEKGENE